jgi:hypothetical protein
MQAQRQAAEQRVTEAGDHSTNVTAWHPAFAASVSRHLTGEHPRHGAHDGCAPERCHCDAILRKANPELFSEDAALQSL